MSLCTASCALRSHPLLSVVGRAGEPSGRWASPRRGESPLVGLITLPTCTQWSSPEERDTWSNANHATGAWASLYALSALGLRHAVSTIESKGFEEAADYELWDLCGHGYCYTAFGGALASHLQTTSTVANASDTC